MLLSLGKVADIDEHGICVPFSWEVVPKWLVVPESRTKEVGLGGENTLHM